ncbi:MAG: mercury transporter [Oscillospiraceae bacterium]|nr:mercury transporter [Oscillospiraceae bacterium]
MNETLKYLLLAVLAAVPVGATIRVIICLLRMHTDPEQESLYKKQAKNVVIYAVIAECAWSILTLVYNYLT